MMSARHKRVAFIVIAALGFSTLGFAQNQKTVPTCSQETFRALKALPKLVYDCPEGAVDYDEGILKLPARLEAIRRVEESLEGFTGQAWWQAGVDDLNACDLHRAAGELTADEKERWRSGDYSFNLIGDHRLRLATIPDPCYQTGYSGSSIFLLYYRNGKVLVSKLVDGYYSRVDNSVGFDFADLNGRQIIEVSTANSMPPSLISYFFEIDPVTGHAAPKKLFKQPGKLTNEIYSDMLMGEPKDLGLPKDAVELNIIRNHRLAPGFSAYVEDERGKIDVDGRKLKRTMYRWNGRFYARV